MYLLRLAIKNVFRKLWRSLVTATPILVGVMMAILGWSMVNGIDQAVILGQIHSDTGHFRLFSPGYLDEEEEAGLDLMVEDPTAVHDLLPADLGARLHPRLRFRGELSDGRDALQAQGFGIDPEAYFADFTLPLEGTLDSSEESVLESLWLGVELAKAFGVQTGDTLTVLARTRYGSYTAEDFIIAGLVRSQNPAIDNFTFFIPLETAHYLLDSDGAVTEVVGFMPTRNAALTLKERLGDLEEVGLEIQTWRERAEPILRVNRLRRKVLGVIVGIILLVAATGIANTVVMAAFERVREIGTLRALGLSSGGVVRLFLYEALLLGVVGSAAGAAFGAWVVHLLRDGLDISAPAAGAGATVSMSTVLYFQLETHHLVVAFFIGLAATLLAALYPSIRFSRLSPMEAMRR